MFVILVMISQIILIHNSQFLMMVLVSGISEFVPREKESEYKCKLKGVKVRLSIRINY